MTAIPFPTELGRPAIGLTYTTYVERFVEQHSELVDYVEVPFELLRYDPSVLPNILGLCPLVLHCASLSIAGFVPPSSATIDAVRTCLEEMKSPWLGEHLAFLTADPLGAFDEIPIGDALSPTNIGYTVSPVRNHQTFEQVIRSLDSCRKDYPVPTILENGPVYLHFDENRMTDSEFLSAIVHESGTKLLLDLTHFCITCRNSGLDPQSELDNFPVEAVHEMHISGMVEENGVFWDNHAVVAPKIVYELLSKAFQRVRPVAITLEYNWSPRFPESELLKEFDRVLSVIEAASTQ